MLDDCKWRADILFYTEDNEIERMAKFKYGKSFEDLDKDESIDCFETVRYFMYGGKPPKYKKATHKEKPKESTT